jgi:y4mF family transcriptional regulator
VFKALDRLKAHKLFEDPKATIESYDKTLAVLRGLEDLPSQRASDIARQLSRASSGILATYPPALPSAAKPRSAEPRIATQPQVKEHPALTSVQAPLRTAADLGAMIRKARKSMKLNQTEFAAHAGVGRRFISELESGKGSLEFDKVLACAAAAGIDIAARSRTG